MQNPQFANRNQVIGRNHHLDSPLKNGGNTVMHHNDMYTLTPKNLGYYEDIPKAAQKRNKYIENKVTRDMLYNQERRR